MLEEFVSLGACRAGGRRGLGRGDPLQARSASETPPNQTAGTGTADVTLDTQSRLLSWTVGYSGLTGPATAAHFHGPPPGSRPA